VTKRFCPDRAEWRLLYGKPAQRLSSYYQLACDYGSSIMLSWEKGGVAPIYLCEKHTAEAGFLAEDSTLEPLSTPPLDAGAATQELNSSAPPAGSINLQDVIVNEFVPVNSAPELSPTANHSATVLVDENIENTSREDFEAYGTVLRSKASAVTEEQSEASDAERLCVSGYGDPCTYESTVHCPKCRKWFCDAHAEDGNWHCCVRTI
jgi:hypothetical protein